MENIDVDTSISVKVLNRSASNFYQQQDWKNYRLKIKVNTTTQVISYIIPTNNVMLN